MRRTPAILALLLVALVLVVGTLGRSHSVDVAPGPQLSAQVITDTAALAYGVVSPLCETCEPPVGYSPLDRNASRNLAIRRDSAGTWCLAITRLRSRKRLVVVASALGGQEPKAAGVDPNSLALAQWNPTAPDCHSRTEVEIQTAWTTVHEGRLTILRSPEVAFSLVVY